MLAVQQQQRALAAAAAAQHSAATHGIAANPLFQANVLQNFAQNLMANGINSQQPTGQTFFCIFCMKHFNTQASFTLHLSFVHFRNNAVNASMQNCLQEQFDKEVTLFFFFFKPILFLSLLFVYFIDYLILFISGLSMKLAYTFHHECCLSFPFLPSSLSIHLL